MLWLYLLGAVTVLAIALRRVLQRQKPLDDELYSKKVAIDYIHSGVAWVRANGTLGSMNPALAATLKVKYGERHGQDWLLLFPQKERARVKEVYSQALLLGIASLDTYAERSDGSLVWINIVIVSVHDHRMRFVGHHCLTVDRTREKLLEDKVKDLTRLLERSETASAIS